MFDLRPLHGSACVDMRLLDEESVDSHAVLPTGKQFIRIRVIEQQQAI